MEYFELECEYCFKYPTNTCYNLKCFEQMCAPCSNLCDICDTICCKDCLVKCTLCSMPMCYNHPFLCSNCKLLLKKHIDQYFIHDLTNLILSYI